MGQLHRGLLIIPAEDTAAEEETEGANRSFLTSPPSLRGALTNHSKGESWPPTWWPIKEVSLGQILISSISKQNFSIPDHGCYPNLVHLEKLMFLKAYRVHYPGTQLQPV